MAFNPHITNYYEGLSQGIVAGAGAIAGGIQRRQDHQWALENREDQQSHQMAMQTAERQGQAAYRQAAWDREDKQKASEEAKQTAEQADFVQGAFEAMSAAGMVSPEEAGKFNSANLKQKSAMITTWQSSAYAKWKAEQADQASAKMPPTVQEVPGTDYVYASQGGRGGSFLPASRPPQQQQPPEGFVPRSYSPQSGTTYGPPPAARAPETREVTDKHGNRITVQWDAKTQTWVPVQPGRQPGATTMTGLYGE